MFLVHSSKVQAKLILNPRICLRALFTSVQVTLSSQLPREQFANPEKQNLKNLWEHFSVLPWNVAGHLLWWDDVWAVIPWLETGHLRLWGWLLHPLDNLPVGNNVDILTPHLQINQ